MRQSRANPIFCDCERNYLMSYFIYDKKLILPTDQTILY